MYNDQAVIKRNFEISLLNKFGEQIKNDIFLLIDKLSGKDTFINNNLWLTLQNILPLTKKEALYFVNLALEFSLASAVIPVLLFEKIPTLSFYGVTKEVCQFLSNIQDYGTRSVAYFLGCDQQKIDDLVHTLEQSTISFYKKLLDAVNTRHHEFGLCCALIMRYSAKLETVIDVEEINTYLDICATLIRNYGTDITEQYIRSGQIIIPHIPLENNLAIIEALAKKSLAAAEFSLTHPTILFAFLKGSPGEIIDWQQNTTEDIKKIKIELLKSEDYFTFLNNPFLFEDKDFLSLMTSWPKLSSPIKANILFQLQKDNYKNFIVTNDKIQENRTAVNQATQSNWLKSWTFCGEVVDLFYIRKRMGALLQDQSRFSIEAKTIVNKHRTIFDRSNTEYNDERVSGMIKVLLSYGIDEATNNELSAMLDFISGNHRSLKNILSKTTLVVQAWERDPWGDYGRSDELFSCTTIGDYNVGNAPGFLSDLNLNKLDIWNNAARIGRIHLCLTKDMENNTVLLLDCVDGTERMLISKKKFELILSSVLAYTNWLGINKIKINYDVDYNTTPKKFITHVEKTYGEQNRIDFISRYLTLSTAKYLIPYPCQTFLESFIKNDGAFVRGVMISL